MADTKISALTALTGANTAAGDLFPLADVSATTTKSITLDELKIALGVTRKYCRVYLNATQSVNNGTGTDVSWTAEANDPDSIMTVPQAYVVVPTGMTQCRVTVSVMYATGATGDRLAAVYRRNSSNVDQEVLNETLMPAAPGGSSRVTVSTGWFDASATERIVILAYQTSGGSVNLQGSGTLTNDRTQGFFEFR